jgi:CubicO group peptidase (beta-lactamase class C family)
VYKLIILLVLCFNLFANELSTDDQLSITLENIRIKNQIPAMAVVIISQGEVTYINGFGFVDELKTKPTTKETLFRIASISKLFTAQAIMQLVEDKELGLDDTIGQYLALFENSKITIRQLLTHSSGLSDVVEPLDFDNKRTQQSYLNLVKNSVPHGISEQKFAYSDTGFNLLGSVISGVSGIAYEKYIMQNILTPAGMKNSGHFDGGRGFVAEAVPTYNGKLIEKAEQRPYDPSFNPSEGLVASADDLSRWLRLTLANSPSILTETAYKEMLEPQLKTVWGDIYMGLGWQVYKIEDTIVARHPGSVRGYKSLVLTYPQSKNAMILLTNSSNTPRWDIAKSITKIMQQNAEWK